MSLTHPVFVLAFTDSQAQILFTPCPGAKALPLAESIQQLADLGVCALLTLLPEEEILANQVEALPQLCEQAGMRWFHLPIEDDHAPEKAFRQAWQNTKAAVHSLLDEGKSIAIHCKGGTGRTGTVAAQILLERGVPLAEVIEQVRATRPQALRIECQLNYIEQLANNAIRGN